MRFGIHLPHIGHKASAEAIRRAAVQAEELGFDDVWASDHIAVPKDSQYPPSPLFYEPILSMTWAAAATSRIGIGSSVLILPMRQPVQLAKELGTLDLLSGERLVVGVGVGWLEAEFAAMGQPFRQRGRRSNEAIELMRACWREPAVTYEAPSWRLSLTEMRLEPRPHRDIPIWVGGNSEQALRRAARLGNGWHGVSCTPQELGQSIATLQAAGVPDDFAISMRMSVDGLEDDPDAVRGWFAAYQQAGAHHLLLEPRQGELDDWLAAVEALAGVADEFRGG